MASCQKENIIESVLQKNVETRGSEDICNNLIANGDFEDWNCFNGLSAMSGNQCSMPWKCYHSSPDIVGWIWTWNNVINDPWWATQSFDNSTAFICCGNGPEHSEGFFQRVVTNPNTTYCFSVDVASTAWENQPNNGNLTLHVQFDSSLPTECSTFEGQTAPVCNQDAVCVDILIPDSYEYPNLYSFSVDLPQGIS